MTKHELRQIKMISEQKRIHAEAMVQVYMDLSVRNSHEMSKRIGRAQAFAEMSHELDVLGEAMEEMGSMDDPGTASPG